MRRERDEKREERINMRIVVDAYTPHERAMGWYCYLEDMVRFPFAARCGEERTVSPLNEGEEVRVLELSSPDACQSEMFVTIEWESRGLGVPLSQLEPDAVDDETAEAIADWHYWDERNYSFA